MDNSTLDSFLERIRSDDTLWRRLMEVIQSAASGSQENISNSTVLLLKTLS